MAALMPTESNWRLLVEGGTVAPGDERLSKRIADEIAPVDLHARPESELECVS
jgi:hypothetical protein